jgi:dihydrofolate synthase/folylpolyglutamate synthase
VSEFSGAATPSPKSSKLLARLQLLHPKVLSAPPAGPQGDRPNLSLDRIRALLADLGNPHLKIPPVIHVAGTKGKGSTVAFLRSMLEAGGKRVHSYTSPHLVRFHERIVVAGKEISEDALVSVLEECERVNDGRPITFFEIANAAAFLAFSRTPADFTLLEVGLGGRLDSTNVIEHPLATVITQVGLDHIEFLGSTIEEIAFEKAGILKRGVPAIVARQVPEAETVIEREAIKRGDVELIMAGSDFDAHEEHGRMVFQDSDGLLDLPLPRLLGRHQIGNAALAIATLRKLDIPGVGEAAIAEGLRSVDWPARLQRLSGGPLAELAPEGADVWLDGAHNLMSGEALAQTMTEIEERSPRPLYLIVGMLKTKDAEGLLAAFKGLARHVFTVPVAGSAASLSAGALYDIASSLGFDARPAHDVAEALEFAAELAEHDLVPGEAPRILICGSLYLAGEVLALSGRIK